MKAVILVAGPASRLRPLTDSTPKCLLEVGGAPILKRALAALESAGIRSIVIVTGYLAERVREAASSWFPGPRGDTPHPGPRGDTPHPGPRGDTPHPGLAIEFVHNERWQTTNNCVSVHVAAEAVGGSGFLLLDGDVVFDARVIERLCAAPAPNALVLRRADNLGEEEMKVEVDGAGRVRTVSKAIPPAQAAGESVGICRFTSGAGAIFSALDARIRGRGLDQEWYESSFQQAIDDGLEIGVVDAAGFIAEIDTAEDLAAVDRALRTGVMA